MVEPIRVQQTSGTTGDLFGVSFTDPNNGTAVGTDYTTAIILRTTDGGATWVSQYSGSDVQFSAVSFTDANTGTAVGSLGAIVRTTDAGSHLDRTNKWDIQFAPRGFFHRCK